MRDDNDEDDVDEETTGDIVTILIRIVHPTQASRKVGFKQRDISNMLNRWEQIIQENGVTFTALRSATLTVVIQMGFDGTWCTRYANRKAKF